MLLGPGRIQQHHQNLMLFLLWSIPLSIIGMVYIMKEFNAPVGGTAFLSGGTPVNPDQQIEWNSDATGSLIASRHPGLNSTYAERCVRDKCILFANGTLRMDQLLSTDNGSYTVTLMAGSLQIKERVQLNVYNPLTPPFLTSSSSIRPVNGTSLSLTCNAGAQTVHSYYFYKNDQLLDCSPPHLSCTISNPRLHFNPVLDSDTAVYTCVIQNLVSSNTSAAFYVNVAVPVSGVTLLSSTTRPLIVEKETVMLFCFSNGTDISYNWTLMGSPLPLSPRYQLINNNSRLVISPVSRSDQGAFTCKVSNYLNSEISNPLNLSWFPDGHLECGAEHLDQSVQLYCSWPGGYPPAAVHLMYENLSESGIDRTTTTVPSYQFSLGTQLTCSGSYVGSSETCSLVIDTPQSVGFINDSIKTINMGSSGVLFITLNSSKAAQILPAKFSWFLLGPSPSQLYTTENIFIISNDYSSFLIIPDMATEFNGQYMCKAENPMGSNAFTFILNVHKEETLSVGTIAGIVIGSVVAVALVAVVLVLIFWIHRKNTNKDETQRHSRQSSVGSSQSAVYEKPVDIESSPSENNYASIN